MPEGLLDVMISLYESEINCGVQTFYDGGFEVWLGDEMNGRKATAEFDPDELGDAGVWLRSQACQIFPNSAFAQSRQHIEALQALIDMHGGFTSWCLLPTILCGTWESDSGNGGWVYLYWIKGRLGFAWASQR